MINIYLLDEHGMAYRLFNEFIVVTDTRYACIPWCAEFDNLTVDVSSRMLVEFCLLVPLDTNRGSFVIDNNLTIMLNDKIVMFSPSTDRAVSFPIYRGEVEVKIFSSEYTTDWGLELCKS